MNLRYNQVTFLCAVCFIFMCGCIPAHLQKYQKNSQGGDAPSNEIAEPDMTFSGVDPTAGRTPQKSWNSGSSPTPAIYPIDQQTYRFQVKDSDVWDAVLSVLLKNYNLTIVNRETGIITTEWDSFYLKQTVYRNKVSVRVRRISWNASDVTIHNSVERLQDGSSAGTVGAVWLPAEDVANESARLVQNMALALNKTPPISPSGVVATEKSDRPAN